MKTSINSHIKQFLESRADNHERRLRLLVFLISICMFIIGVPLHIFGFIGVDNGYTQALSAGFWLTCVIILALYLKKKLSLIRAIGTFALLAQITESLRIVYLTLTTPPGYEAAIVLNQVIALTIVIYEVIAFIRIIPVVTTLINLPALYFAFFHDSHAVSLQLVVIFTFVEIFTCIMGDIIQRNIHSMQRENTDYMATQDGILKAFHMNKSELVAYIQLCRANGNDQQAVNHFFEQLDEQSEANLIKAVELRKTEQQTEREQFARYFPQLTPTELEVCRLVAKGRTLNEIARITNKNANNISSVRIHIRKKLGLVPGEDLRTALLTAMD